jgi:hypothetical protein
MRPSVLSLLVFVAGITGAVWSGVATYRAVGLYGGPILTGFHREWDPRSGRYQLIHETTIKSGLHVRRVLTDDLQVLRTDLSGVPISPALEKLVATGAVEMRTGFSTLNDGVIDAWSIRDANPAVTRVEMSTRRDGKIDRWERYENGKLVRVDLDTNRNGKPDQWMTYEEGILMDTFFDVDEDGKPDGPPIR